MEETLEVILKDFDGTRTIYPAKLPLTAVISNDVAEEGIPVVHHYAKTEQRDDQGRIVYEERR